jgi:2-polyprenyl-3-methyl-5-hydroxy-6-metoxy-1,4-benzoquinol methylase
MSQFECKICSSELYSPLRVKEMMYGKASEFDYGLCHNCQCLQLMTVPENLAEFYPKNYYSFSTNIKKRSFKTWKKVLRRKITLNHPEAISFLFSAFKKSQPLFWIYRILGLKSGMETLDVGAGGGAHVLELRSVGVSSLGVDPYIDTDLTIENDLVVKKSELNKINQKFDLITFHHSFEHISEQLGTLTHAKSLLKHGGKILIRIPTISSWAFEEYQENWFQLDAPRHLFLHSHKSIKILANKAGLKVINLWCDSSETQFIASEQYRMGMTLLDPRSYEVNKKQSIWSKSAIKKFKEKARNANNSMKGDQICVVLVANQL